MHACTARYTAAIACWPAEAFFFPSESPRARSDATNGIKLRIGCGSKKAIAIDFYLMILRGMPQPHETAPFLRKWLFRRVKDYEKKQ